MDNNWILEKILWQIKTVIVQNGEKNFFISFSGGKDSTILSALVDMALPDNKIPRVFVDTGIEYSLIRQFVLKTKEESHNWELIILQPKIPLKPMLEQVGYPFKSKMHSRAAYEYQNGKKDNVYCRDYRLRNSSFGSSNCPMNLLYQFENDWKEIKISDKCCDILKKEPIAKYKKQSKRKIAMIGLLREEAGRRKNAQCQVFEKGNLRAFQPLVNVTKEWQNWLIKEYNIDISDIYKPPYNFQRTGCKGCPFALELQYELDILEKFFPNERKQCEAIWKPVYEEYRKIGYRLNKNI